jgi:IclR family transcriptional regulator, mhp operon transcriptional activator
VPVMLEGRVVAAINLTWRRQVLALTGLVQRHLGDLQAAVHTVEERARAAGFGGVA